MKILVPWILAALILAGGSVSAYDIVSLAGKTLSKNFIYKDIPETQSLSFGGGEIPYHMGQLSIIRKKARMAPSAKQSGLQAFFWPGHDWYGVIAQGPPFEANSDPPYDRERNLSDLIGSGLSCSDCANPEHRQPACFAWSCCCQPECWPVVPCPPDG